MQNPNHIIMRFSAMTGIRDPKVDAWVQNQELYKQHGMAHPSLKKKAEVERRSRSPLVPGPRKTKSFQEELFDKYLAEFYPVMPERLIRFHFLDNQYIVKELFPWGFPAEVDGFWKSATETRVVDNPRGRGNLHYIYPWKPIVGPNLARSIGEVSERIDSLNRDILHDLRS